MKQGFARRGRRKGWKWMDFRKPGLVTEMSSGSWISESRRGCSAVVDVTGMRLNTVM